MSHIKQYYFSATGTTQKVVQTIAQHLSTEIEEHDLLRKPLSSSETLPADTVAVIGMPVYSGRIPTHCAEMLAKLKGTNTPAIAVVVYGNRDYDDALLELTDILTNNSFLVYGAGAVVAQHSIFSSVGKARQDQSDFHQIADNARQCAIKLEQTAGTEKPIKGKGNSPYKKNVPVTRRTTADNTDRS